MRAAGEYRHIFVFIFFGVCAVAAFSLAGRFDIRLRAQGEPAQIHVYPQQKIATVSMDQFRAFAQGGEEKSDMIAPVAPSVGKLNPRIIRIDHIYDYFTHVTVRDGRVVADFSLLDDIVRSIRKTGAVPMLSLSYMPIVLSDDNTVTGKPRSWKLWSDLVHQTVSRYSGKASGIGGGSVYYEVWNEPDLFGKWTPDGTKSYALLYRHSVLGALQASDVHDFSIGGPATTGLRRDFIEAIARTNLRCDFLSWHSYLSDPDRFVSDDESVSKWMGTYPQLSRAKKMITEYGFTGEKSQKYGTDFASAYTMAVIRTMVSRNTTLVAFELVDGPGDSGDGWGLLAHPSKGAYEKPRYKLFELLSDLGEEPLVLVTGEGSWVKALAFGDQNRIVMLLVNFDAKQAHVETVPITIFGLDNGDYAMKMKYASGPEVPFTEKSEAGVLRKLVFMPVNSIIRLDIERK